MEVKNHEQPIRILCSILAQVKDELHFDKGEYLQYFNNELSFDELDRLLHYFCKVGLFDYISGGEDGFAVNCSLYLKTGSREKIAAFIISETDAIKNELLDKLSMLENTNQSLLAKIDNLSKDKELLLSFSPEKVAANIQNAVNEIDSIKSQITQNQMLKPLEPTLQIISDYLRRIESVNNVFSNVYVNIIKPVKEEGQKGVKATMIWAIASIIFAALLSLIPPYWDKITGLFHNHKYAEYKVNGSTSSNLSKIERELNFIIMHLLNIDKDYKPSTDNLLIKRFDRKLILGSKDSGIYIEPYRLEETKKKGQLLPVISLRVYINANMMSIVSLSKVFKIIDASGLARFHNSQINLSEGDKIIYKNEYTINVERIFRTFSEVLPVADTIDAVMLRIHRNTNDSSVSK